MLFNKGRLQSKCALFEQIELHLLILNWYQKPKIIHKYLN